MMKTAIRAATMAGDIVDRYFGRLAEVKAKDLNQTDFVTAADIEAEGAIHQIIRQTYPDHGFWGEETGQHNVDREYVWVVDSLDGTSNFIYNIPLYSVSLALMHRSEVILGVVYIPKTDELFRAEKGKGAFCNDWRMAVSKTAVMKDAVCSIEYWSRDKTYQERGLNDIVKFARQTKKYRYLSSVAFELCRVAKGDLDFSIMDTTFVDIAASKLIVEEAGGVCRLYEGGPTRQNATTDIMRIVVSNQALDPLIK